MLALEAVLVKTLPVCSISYAKLAALITTLLASYAISFVFLPSCRKEEPLYKAKIEMPGISALQC